MKLLLLGASLLALGLFTGTMHAQTPTPVPQLPLAGVEIPTQLTPTPTPHLPLAGVEIPPQATPTPIPVEQCFAERYDLSQQEAVALVQQCPGGCQGVSVPIALLTDNCLQDCGGPSAPPTLPNPLTISTCTVGP
jgi:hypothetical protein